MIFEVKDLIYLPEEDNCEKVQHRIAEKYPMFLRSGEDFANIDIRSKTELQNSIKSDVSHILHTITRLTEENGVQNFIVRHCYDPDGRGYYAVCDTESNYRRFVKSDYRLTTIGGCWSYFVWRMLLSADVLLFWYLKQVRNKLQHSHKSVKMEIRHLYLPYITSDATVILEYEEESIFQNVLSVIDEYKKLHASEYEEYCNCKAHEKNWYDGEENDTFYTVRNIIQKAVNEIYRNEARLKSCGLWEKAYAVKDILIDLEYERGDFAYLKKQNASHNNTSSGNHNKTAKAHVTKPNKVFERLFSKKMAVTTQGK